MGQAPPLRTAGTTFINRVQPAPLESLASVVARLRHANHYIEPRWLADVVPQPPSRLNLLCQVRHYAALSALTGLDLRTLVGLTLHRFTLQYFGWRHMAPSLPTGQPPVERSILSMLQTTLWPTTGRTEYAQPAGALAVCPRCWQEQHAVLLPWSLSHVTTCRRHQVLLVDRCPGCAAALDLDPTRDACDRCGLAIAAYPASSIADDAESRALTEVVWHMIGCAAHAAGTSPGTPARPVRTVGELRPALRSAVTLPPEHPVWRVEPAGLLCALWSAAQRSVAAAAAQVIARPDRWDTHESEPAFVPATRLPEWRSPYPYSPLTNLIYVGVARRHAALLAAWRLLSAWPDTWPTAVPAGPQRDSTTSGTGLPYPVVLEDGRDPFEPPAPPDREGARRRRRPQRRREPQWSFVDGWWLDLVWQRSAEGYPWGRTDLPAEPEAACRAWRVEWHDEDLGLPLEEAATYCQLRPEALKALADAGVLPGTFFPLTPWASGRWRFSERQLSQGLRRLLGVLPVRPLARGKVVDLAGALRRAAPAGVDLTHVLRAVRDGRLPAFRSRATAQLADVWFASADVLTFLSALARARCAKTVKQAAQKL